MLKNKPHFVAFRESILVSEWTFPPTIVNIYMNIYARVYVFECLNLNLNSFELKFIKVCLDGVYDKLLTRG